VSTPAVNRLTYVLRFHRPPKGSAATAPGLTVTTRLEGGTVASELTPLAGAEATLALKYAVNRDGTLFFEWGSVTFGDQPASSLSFSSIGAGTLAAQPDADGFSHGTVAYSVDDGTGALAGARGVINSNFLVDLDTDELIDTHLGIVRLP
jgi:hypothetical protein